MSTIKLIKPSGDTSGATDAASIQAALNALEQPDRFKVPGTLVLGGQYYINTPLVAGNADGWPTSIYGVPHANINYVGSSGSHYMLTFLGYRGFGKRSLIQGCTLNSGWRCRGVQFKHIPHQLLSDGLFLAAFVEVGIDAPSCWCSEIRFTTITGMLGVGIRAQDFNKGIIRGLQMQGYGSHHAAGMYESASTTLWKYEVDNGKAEAEAKYGTNYIQDWPEVDDTSVTTVGGVVVQTLETQRAGLQLHGSNILLESSTFEGSKYCEYPAIYLMNEGPTGARNETGLNVMHALWLESCSNRWAKIVVQGNEYGGTFVSGLTRIHDVFAVDTTQDNDSCRALVELRGTTRSVSVSNIYTTKIGTAVLYAASGTHTDPMVSDAKTYSGGVVRSNWVAKAGGATIAYSSNNPVHVPVFADATARDAAWATPVAGWSCYLTSPGAVNLYTGSAWVTLTQDVAP